MGTVAEEDGRGGAPPRHALAYADLMRARERVRGALEPHLGAVHALERANNIAQALAFDDIEPEQVAFDMLRQLPRDQRAQIARLVRTAWLLSLSESRSRAGAVARE